MPRYVNRAPMFIKVLVVLSLILFSAQVILLASRCKCNQNRFERDQSGGIAENEKSLHLRSAEENAVQFTVEDFLKLKEENAQLKKKIATFRSNVGEENVDDDEEFDALRGYTPKNEYDVIPFDSFDGDRLYGKVGTLSGNPAEGLYGQRGVEHASVIKFAVKTINGDSESKGDPVTPFHVAEAVMRNDRIHGTSSSRVETIDTSKTIINVIVPLSGRLDKFSSFMKRFVEYGIKMDRRVFLTLVYFGLKGRDDVRSIMRKVELEENFKDYKVIFTSQEFSRGAGLQKGAQIWEGGNVLLFFCDVDVYFKSEFLERCRMHSAPGRKVYYPIVFSQYNPMITYGGEQPPSLDQQMRLSKDTGFWRDFGFGMSCQYRDDFLKVGGFDLTIKGWGMEDVKLYRSHLASKLTVVRAYDRGLFHIYHKKQCQRSLADGQFVSCLQSKAVSEGSHKQMGMLAFGQHIVGETDPNWPELLKFSISAASKPESLPEEVENESKVTKNEQEPRGDNGKHNESYQNYLSETLFNSATELKQILNYISEKKIGSDIIKEVARMKELQMIFLKMSNNILARQT
eukprot:gene17749-19523_t